MVARNGYAYIGVMRAPHGTLVVDVREPSKPKQLAMLEMPKGTHSHKVRVSGDIMVINHEVNQFDSGAPRNSRAASASTTSASATARS